MTSATREVRTLHTGLGIGECARWHDGRLWFASWGPGEIVALDDDGNAQVMATSSTPMGFSFDWLPDGRMIATSEDVLRIATDGDLVPYAEGLGDIATGWNEIVVDGRGNVYVDSINMDFSNFEADLASGSAPGKIALVTPDGAAREVADGLAFPNGMVVTPDNSTLICAESFASQLTAFDIAADGTLSNRRVWAPVTGDGICIDAEGAVWTSGVGKQGTDVVQRIREGGEVLEQIEVVKSCYACMLGGDDGKTLYMMVAEWFGPERIDELLEARTGEILSARVKLPHAGYP